MKRTINLLKRKMKKIKNHEIVLKGFKISS